MPNVQIHIFLVELCILQENEVSLCLQFACAVSFKKKIITQTHNALKHLNFFSYFLHICLFSRY